MNKHSKVRAGIFLAVCLAALFWFRLERSPAASFPAATSRTKSRPENIPNPAVVPFAPAPIPKEKPKPLSPETLAGKFGLDGVAQYKLRNSIGAVYQELVELRGTQARVESHEGNKLVMYLPGLALDDEHLTRIIATRLSESLGEQKTIALLSDEESNAAIDEQLGLDVLRTGVRYRFERVKPENDPAKNFSLGYALFDIAIEYDPVHRSNGSESDMGPHNWHGWSLTNVYSDQLSWNALSQAPPGYFRSEPILGVQSRPEASPTIIRNVDTGSVEILNADHPGSVEVFDPPKS